MSNLLSKMKCSPIVLSVRCRFDISQPCALHDFNPNYDFDEKIQQQYKFEGSNGKEKTVFITVTMNTQHT